MKVLRGDPEQWGPPPDDGSAIAIGVFDGVHSGHRSVLADVARRAADLGGLTRVALTFDRHPRSVIDPASAPPLLTSLEQRIDLLGELDIDIVAVLPFERVRDASPEAFVTRVLVGALAARLVAVGADFRFGRGRTGDVAVLRKAGAEYGFEVDAVELTLSPEGVPVSSSTIRRLVGDGDVATAARLLGRPFTVVGEVVAGDRRGRAIGFPTANVVPDRTFVVPRRGVYAARVWIDDGAAHHAAVVNVGIRPTFGGDHEVVEAHLLAHDADLYGRRIGIEMVERIRDEQTFDGVDALTAQIERDAAEASHLVG